MDTKQHSIERVNTRQFTVYCTDETIADALVSAVNAHASLVERVRELEGALGNMLAYAIEYSRCDRGGYNSPALEDNIRDARALLGKGGA